MIILPGRNFTGTRSPRSDDGACSTMRFRSRLIGLACLAALSPASPTHAQTTNTAPVLALEAAIRAAEAAHRLCLARGWAVAVSVVDRSGIIIAQIRDPMAGAQTPDGAVRKARTSAGFNVPTLKLVEQAKAHPEMAALNSIPDVLILGGGLPLMVDRAPVGGIGVAGAPDNTVDEACARAGADIIEKQRQK